MSEEKNELLTEEESKQLHDQYMSPIMTMNAYLTQLKENRGQLIETLNEIRTEGGIEKLKGLRKASARLVMALNDFCFKYSDYSPALKTFSISKVDDAVAIETRGLLSSLVDVLTAVIEADGYGDMSQVLYNLQTGRSKFIVDAFDENGLIPDDVDDTNDDDDDAISLHDLLEAERNHKKTNK